MKYYFKIPTTGYYHVQYDLTDEQQQKLDSEIKKFIEENNEDVTDEILYDLIRFMENETIQEDTSFETSYSEPAFLNNK